MGIPESDARIFDVMYQCRAMRRLKPDPVPEDVLVGLVDAALQGPSGSNAQNWTFVIVRDVEQKRRIQAVWQRTWRFYLETAATARLREHESQGARARMLSAASHLAEHLHEVPALIFIAVKRDDAFAEVLAAPATAIKGVKQLGPKAMSRLMLGSLRITGMADGATAYPAVQNLLLAARARGLGAVLTTLHFFVPGEFERIIDLPRTVSLAAIVPVGYPHGRFGPVSRPSPREVLSWDRYTPR